MGRTRFRHLSFLYLPLLIWVLTGSGSAQQPVVLTLTQAKELALKNHPRIASAVLVSEATEQNVNEVRSAYYPALSGAFTSAGAQQNATLAAGNLTTSSLYSRVASGLTLGQLVTDFGRTSNLAASAALRARAQRQATSNTKAQVLLEVELAYYENLGAQAVLQAAEAALESRRLLLRQVNAMAQSSLKSTLDVSFAEVSVSEAELELYRAQNAVEAAKTRLAAALGFERSTEFRLADEDMPAALADNPDSLVAQALHERPDLAELALSRDAAQRFAQAEKRLRYPSVSLLGVAGGIPFRDERLHGSYTSVGLNVNIPLLNGGLFSARRAEADLRARAAGDDVKALEVLIARDVRVAWLEARTAFRRLDVTARLVHEADQALRLARVRYDNGLGSIVELNQAQLSQTSAQIEAAGARYDYLSRRAALSYTTGTLP